MSPIDTTILFAYLAMLIMLTNLRVPVDATATFWSVCLSLITVLAWQTAKGLGVDGLFQIDPLYPGLMVSAVSLAVVSALKTVRTS